MAKKSKHTFRSKLPGCLRAVHGGEMPSQYSLEKETGMGANTVAKWYKGKEVTYITGDVIFGLLAYLNSRSNGNYTFTDIVELVSE